MTLTLKDWLEHSTSDQRTELYARAETSYCSLWQVANVRRGISVEEAAKLEEATTAINQ
jgi:hypothetical protein